MTAVSRPHVPLDGLRLRAQTESGREWGRRLRVTDKLAG
ncbi:hypothetical protein NONI108955_43840 [Nocardia ninae]